MVVPDGLLESLPVLLLWFWPFVVIIVATAWTGVSALRTHVRRPRLAIVRAIAPACSKR